MDNEILIKLRIVQSQMLRGSEDSVSLSTVINQTLKKGLKN